MEFDRDDDWEEAQAAVDDAVEGGEASLLAVVEAAGTTFNGEQALRTMEQWNNGRHFVALVMMLLGLRRGATGYREGHEKRIQQTKPNREERWRAIHASFTQRLLLLLVLASMSFLVFFLL
jgi:hypothetical protein